MGENLNIKKLAVKDIIHFEKLVNLFAEVFEMKEFVSPKREYLLELLSKNNFHAFAALNNSDLIGGLTVYTLDQYYSEKPLAYLFDLAVSPQWQRQGIGKILIGETKLYFQQKGYQELFVQADKADDHAVDFYRITKPTFEEQVVHFTWK